MFYGIMGVIKVDKINCVFQIISREDFSSTQHKEIINAHWAFIHVDDHADGPTVIIAYCCHV